MLKVKQPKQKKGRKESKSKLKSLTKAINFSPNLR